MTDASGEPVKRPADVTAKSPHSSRRNTLISLIGATLVFATFIEKDNLRDTTKERLSAIESAEGIFLIRSENRQLDISLKSVSDRLDEIGNEVHFGRSWWMKRKPTPTDTDIHMAVLSMAEVNTSLPSLRESLDNMSELLDRSGLASTQNGQKLSNLKCQLDKLEASTKEANQPLHGVGVSQWKDLRKTADGLEDDMTNIWVDTNTLEQSVLDQARQEKENLKDKLKQYTLWANVLYVVGWSLALAGRLFGFEGFTASS
jgi:hypothetical protein